MVNDHLLHNTRNKKMLEGLGVSKEVIEYTVKGVLSFIAFITAWVFRSMKKKLDQSISKEEAVELITNSLTEHGVKIEKIEENQKEMKQDIREVRDILLKREGH